MPCREGGLNAEHVILEARGWGGYCSVELLGQHTNSEVTSIAKHKTKLHALFIKGGSIIHSVSKVADRPEHPKLRCQSRQQALEDVEEYVSSLL